MSKEIQVALIGIIGTVLAAALPPLLAKPFDLGITVVLVVLLGSAMLVVIYVLGQAPQPARGAGRQSPRKPKGKSARRPTKPPPDDKEPLRSNL